jgi:hypothetical protein
VIALYGPGMHDFIMREMEVGTRVAMAEDLEACGFGVLFDLSYAEWCAEHELRVPESMLGPCWFSTDDGPVQVARFMPVGRTMSGMGPAEQEERGGGAMATRARIQPGDGDPRHGTTNGYNNLKCRCTACRAAWARRVAQRRRDLRIGTLGPNDKRHGTENGYVNYGCRCRRCTDIHTERRRPKAAQ